MRVLIGTPAGQGQVTTQYLLSVMSMLGPALKHKIEPVIYTLSQESLLPRGRNHCAQVAMRDKFDKLFFIDADSGFAPQDFLQLVFSPFPIIAGCVPLKTYPTTLNYMPFKDDEKYFVNALRSPEATRRMRADKGMAEVPVAYTGTAFLCIDTSVLYKLSETEKTYQYPNPHTGEQETHWDFFGGGPMHGKYLSEDWAFCEKAREIGYDIRVNMDVFINHVGTHVYRVNPHIPVDHAPEVFRPLLCRITGANAEQLGRIDQAVRDIAGDELKVKPKTVVAPQADVLNPAGDIKGELDDTSTDS